jgi:hypothetical protein
MFIRQLNVTVLASVIIVLCVFLQNVKGWGGGSPPSPNEIASQVSSKWLARDFNDLDSYITNLYSSYPNYIPAILASCFQDFVYKGHLSDAMQKFNQVKQWVEQNPGVVSEDFITQMYIIEWCIQSEIDMYANHNISEAQLQPNPNAVRDACGNEPFPLIEILEYCDFAISQIWTDPNWDYRKKITIQNTNIDSNLANFALYVKIDSDPNIGAHAQADGDDIVFTSSNGVTTLSYEKESFGITNGIASGDFWVKVPVIDSNSSTDIYIYYGNPDANNMENAEAVWDNGQVGIWHMTEGTGSTVADSTSKNNNGTITGAAWSSSGKIGNALNFDGTNDYADLPVSDITYNAGTVLVWFNRTGPSISSFEMIAEEYVNGSRYYILTDPSGNILFRSGPNVQVDAGDYTNGEWYLAALSWNSSKYSCYVNGSKIINEADTTLAYSPQSFQIGAQYGNSVFFNGRIDNMMIYNRILTDSEIKFIYYNQNETDNELIWAVEEDE